MRFVPGLLVISFAAFLLASATIIARNPVATLHACEHKLNLPGFQVEPSSGDSLRATIVRANRSWTLLVLCRPNLKKTNPADELVAEARERGDLVRDVVEVKTQLGTAVLFKRTSHETLVMRLEANVASREFVYLYVMIPEKGKNATAQEWLEMQKLFGEVVATAESANQTPAISEDSFRKRLVVFFALLIIVFGTLAWFLIRRFLWKKGRTV
ncbi:MAG: hypothetical protein JNM27_07985 [Leptospirales bacterium]|nr:hypothetical protein [Leptospirales bacterium]